MSNVWLVSDGKSSSILLMKFSIADVWYHMGSLALASLVPRALPLVPFTLIPASFLDHFTPNVSHFKHNFIPGRNWIVTV